MRVYKDEEMRWSTLRYDSRTFTAQQAKMLKGDVTRKEIPEKYIYIDDGCFGRWTDAGSHSPAKL